jgi:glycosyltransferase involved in cell wall biosynthesis
MKVIIIEPLLKDQSGHQFSYTIALHTELEKRNISVSILGNILGDKLCSKLRNFHPHLNEVTSTVFNSLPTLKSLYRIYHLIKLLRDQFDSFFFDKYNLKMEREFVLYLHSLYIFELISFGLFLQRRAKIFVRNKHKIIIGFNFSCKQHSILSTVVLSFLYKYVFTFLVKDLHSQIIYFSDGEFLKREYEKLLKKKIYFLPVPLNNKLSEFYINSSKQGPNRKKITMCYVGGARYNKGFDILVKIIEKLFNEEEVGRRVLLTVQIDIHRQQLRKDVEIVLEAVKKLEDLANRFKNIQLIYGVLPLEQYYQLLAKTDAVVLPYRENFFRSVPSQIFRETIVLGKTPVVSSNTTMSFELMRYNLDDLIFDLENIESFIFVTKKIICNIDTYRAKIKELQQKWLQFYSASHLVNQLLTLAS